jgi:hypothetical protein
MALGLFFFYRIYFSPFVVDWVEWDVWAGNACPTPQFLLH